MPQVHLLSVMFTCWPADNIVFKIHTLHVRVIFAVASSALTSQVLIRLSGPFFHNFLCASTRLPSSFLSHRKRIADVAVYILSVSVLISLC